MWIETCCKQVRNWQCIAYFTNSHTKIRIFENVTIKINIMNKPKQHGLCDYRIEMCKDC